LSRAQTIRARSAPSRRRGEREEIDASDRWEAEASFANGTVLTVDGRETAGSRDLPDTESLETA